jgi:hypothetical protein
VSATERAAYGVIGYEQERTGGGANHIIDRQRLDGAVWHDRHSADCFAHRNGHQERLL